VGDQRPSDSAVTPSLSTVDSEPTAVTAASTSKASNEENDRTQERVQGDGAQGVAKDESNGAQDGLRQVAQGDAKGSDAQAVKADGARFPAVKEVTGLSVGPSGRIAPKPIAAGRILHRETNVSGLDDLLRLDGQAEVRQMYVTDNSDLAIGQGDNKGVRITFRPDSLSGRENKKPGTGQIAGREYQTDVVAPRAVQSITMSMADSKKLRPLTKRRLSDFDRQDNGDGTITFHRKGLERAPPNVESDSTQPANDQNPQDGTRAQAPADQAPAAEGSNAAAPAGVPATGAAAAAETGGVANKRKVSAPAAKAAAAREQKRADFFTPGNVVPSYGGGFDEVLSYTPTPDGGFSVKVHAVKKNKDGEWVRVGKPQDARQHATNPDARELAAGPVARLESRPAADVKYSEPRGDGQSFPNAAPRGAAAPPEAQSAAPERTPQTQEEVDLRKRLGALEMLKKCLSS